MTTRHPRTRRVLAGAALLALGLGCGAAPRSAAPRPGYAIEPTVPELAEEKREVEVVPQGGAAAPVVTDAAVDPSSSAAPVTKKPAPKPTPPSTTITSPVTPSPPPPPTVAPRPSKAAGRSEDLPRAAAKEPREEAVVTSGVAVGSTGGASMPPASILPGPPAIQIAAAQANFDEASRQLAGATGDCARLCKALASMQRATERLCGLVASGSDSEKRRCVDARARLSAATAKVTAACGACTPP